MGTWNDCYRHAETQREYWMAGFGPIVANRFKSRLRDIHSYRSISSTNWELTFADGAHRWWRTYPAIYREFVEVISKAKAEALRPHRSIDHAIDLEPSYNLPYGRITIERSSVERSFQLSWVESSGIHAIAWIKVTCSRGRILHLDLDLKIPCHMDWSMSGYFLMVDMSPDFGTAMKSQWKTDIMEVSKYYL